MVHTHAWKVDRLEHILDLSNRGEYLDEETWDLEGVASDTRRMVRKYNTPWDPECVIPSNLNLSGSIFQAGIELADQPGFFSTKLSGEDVV